MTMRDAMPTVWVALPDGSGIVEYDPTAHGHTLDLEADDDTKPLVIDDWIVQILGFDPLTESGFEDEKGETRQKLIFEGAGNDTVDKAFASVNKSNSQFIKSGIQRNQPNNTSLPNTGAVHVYKGGQLPAQRAWNGAPGITGKHLSEFHDAPLTQRAEYQEAIANILIDQVGYDVIGRNFELVGGVVLQTPGDYHPRGKGAYVQARVDTDDDGHVNTDTRNRLDAAEAVRGALLRQDAAGWFLPVYIEDLSPKQQNLLDISISRPLANEEVLHVRELLADEMGSDFFSPIPTASGFRLLNVPDASGLSNVVFQRRAQAALKKANLPDMEGVPLYADDSYIQNDWKDNPHGEAYHEAIAGTGSSGLQRTANKLFTTLGPELANLESEFERNYGWSPDSKTRFWQKKAQTGDRTRTSLDDFKEEQHPRGQPENKGEFAKTSGSTSKAAPVRTLVATAPATQGTGAAPALFTPEDMALPTNASQPFNTMEAINQGTIAAQDQLATWLNKGKGVGAELGYTTMSVPPEQADLGQSGGMLFIAPPKSSKRMAEKVQSDYGGDFSKLLDPVRCTFACDNFGEVKRVLGALKASGMKLARRPKDRFANPTDAGYRDCLLNVVMPNGMIGEVQLHTKAMLQAKDEGHKWYEIERTLDAESKTRNLTVEERQHKAAAGTEMNRIYAEAWTSATKGMGRDALWGSGYSYYSYNNTYFRRRSNFRRSVDDVLHGNRWVPYTGDCLAPVIFGDRCGDPLGGTGDADFNEEDHPRGQPGNAGQFASTPGSSKSSSKATSTNKLLDELGAMEKEAYKIDPSTAEAKKAWHEVAQKRTEYRKAQEEEAARGKPPGKVIKRPKPPTEDQTSEYATMYPEDFRKESGMWSHRERRGDTPSRRLKAVGDVRAAIMGLPKSHRKKLEDTTVKNIGTLGTDTKTAVRVTGANSGWAGLYNGSEDTAYVVDFVTTKDGREFALEDTGGVAVHELGHALDHKLNLSGSGYFQEGVNEDMKGLTEAQRKAAEYYLQAYSEMTAESYNMCFSNAGSAFGMPKSEAWEAFKNTRERLGALLQQKGLDVYAGILAT